MQFRIADTFTLSLGKLQSKEQKAAKTTAFDLQMNPATPGFKFHRIDRSKDPNFWSVRVNQDIRLIVHKTSSSLMLCYVDHHDDAYAWAERRRIETHPRTGAAQLVVIPERIEETARITQAEPLQVSSTDQEVARELPLLFEALDKDALLNIGVPEDWISEVQSANEDSLFDVAEYLPAEATEALLEYVSTGKLERLLPDPTLPMYQTRAAEDPFVHPDAQRRFRVFSNLDELKSALEYPWEKWAVFLHPIQRQFVEREYNGPARISGSAGTGKTIVALHRAVLLARHHPSRRILLTTFSKTLANALQMKLQRLAVNEPGISSRITVSSILNAASDLYRLYFESPRIVSEAEISSLLRNTAEKENVEDFRMEFLKAEWEHVVDSWNLRDWDSYRDVSRLGRKTRIGGKQRERLWSVFQHVLKDLDRRGNLTHSGLFWRMSEHLTQADELPYDHVIIDEAQDIGVAELSFLSALGRKYSDGLFFAGDLGQRIFQQPFSWRSLGIDIRGRSHTLQVNYRTSHQIRTQADRLLPSALSDVDGNEENRTGTVSVFNGPAPVIRTFDTESAETEAVSDWLGLQLDNGIQPHEIGIFVRSREELQRAKQAASLADIDCIDITDNMKQAEGEISIGTMHLAKGLEFKCVAVMACDDEVIPSQHRIENVTDISDLDDVYETERHLLYVACTRARDHLLVTGIEPASEFLDDLLV